MMRPDYTYYAKVNRWIDGDTVDLDVDLGFEISIKTRFRLYGINSPERFTPEGILATGYNNTMCPPGTRITIKTYKDGQEKYGRWLCTIYVVGMNLNDALVVNGHAKYKEY